VGQGFSQRTKIYDGREKKKTSGTSSSSGAAGGTATATTIGSDDDDDDQLHVRCIDQDFHVILMTHAEVIHVGIGSYA
jgi:hypothetical protein